MKPSSNTWGDLVGSKGIALGRPIRSPGTPARGRPGAVRAGDQLRQNERRTSGRPAAVASARRAVTLVAATTGQPHAQPSHREHQQGAALATACAASMPLEGASSRWRRGRKLSWRAMAAAPFAQAQTWW